MNVPSPLTRDCDRDTGIKRLSQYRLPRIDAFGHRTTENNVLPPIPTNCWASLQLNLVVESSTNGSPFNKASRHQRPDPLVSEISTGEKSASVKKKKKIKPNKFTRVRNYLRPFRQPRRYNARLIPWTIYKPSDLSRHSTMGGIHA